MFTPEQKLVTAELDKLHHDHKVAIEYLSDLAASRITHIPSTVMQRIVRAASEIEAAKREYEATVRQEAA